MYVRMVAQGGHFWGAVSYEDVRCNDLEGSWGWDFYHSSPQKVNP